MIKCFGSLCILWAGVWSWLEHGRYCRRQLQTMQLFAATLERMGTEIQFRRLPLPRILKQLCESAGNQTVSAFYESVLEQLRRGVLFQAAWKLPVQRLPMSSALKLHIGELGGALTGDEQTACCQLAQVRQEIWKEIAQLRQQLPDVQKRWGAISLSGALFLIILLM